MERERKVYPDCVNASNAFHQCSDHCLHRRQNPNFKINRSKGPAVGNGRRADADRYCVNAANPFHRCGVHCSKKMADAKKFNGTGKLAQNGALSNEIGKRGARNLNPSCTNVSNPFHQCTEYCSQRTSTAKKLINGK